MLPLLMAGGAALGGGLGWIGSKIDDEGASKYISKPINWLTGDSVLGGAAAGALAPVGGALGGGASKFGLKYLPNTALGWRAGRAGYLGSKAAGAGFMAGAINGGHGSSPQSGSLGGMFAQGIGNMYGGMGSQPTTLGGMYPELAQSFTPSTLGWSPSPFGAQAPSTNIATYNNDEGLEGMLQDATDAANLPLKQNIKTRRDSQRKNVGVLKALGRDTQRDIRKTIAQKGKAQEKYEELAAKADEAARQQERDIAKEVGDADLDRAESVDKAIRQDTQRNLDDARLLADSDDDLAKGQSDSLLSLLEGLGEAETYDVQDKVNREVVDAQDDVDALRNQMAANAAQINTDYRAQLAGTNMDSAWNKYAMDYDKWNRQNTLGLQAAQMNQSALNAAKDRIQNIYSGFIGGGMLPGPYGYGAAGASEQTLPQVSANLSPQMVDAFIAQGVVPEYFSGVPNVEFKVGG